MSSPRSTPPDGCPVCGSPDRLSIYDQRLTTIEGGHFLEGYEVCVCAACGMGYAAHLPSQDALDRYYRERSKYEERHLEGTYSEWDRLRHASTADFLRQRVPEASSVLEIGCATGGLLHALAERGFRHLRGLDPSPTCVRVAVEHYGIPAEIGYISDSGRLTGPFDLIILDNVLEHVMDISTALETVSSVLSANGRIFAEVPNVSDFLANMTAPFQEFSLEHIRYFSPLSLQNFFQRWNWVPVDALAPTSILFKRSSPPGASSLAVDKGTETALRGYVAASSRLEEGFRRAIDRMKTLGEPIIIWGAGSLTLHLLAAGAFDGIPILAFIDSNPRYRRLTIGKHPILSPAAVASLPSPILIGSILYQKEIVDQIQRRLKLANRVFVLDGDVD